MRAELTLGWWRRSDLPSELLPFGNATKHASAVTSRVRDSDEPAGADWVYDWAHDGREYQGNRKFLR